MENKTNTKMENWKKEIKRLDAIRLKLGLNNNQIAVLTGIGRGNIGNFFSMSHEPKLGFYLKVKSVLENEIEVNKKPKKEVHRDGGVSVSEAIKEKAEPTNDCDCYMSGNIFLRGKSGCKKTKDEHKF